MKSASLQLALGGLTVLMLAAVVTANAARAAQPAYLLDAFGRGNAIIETSGPRCLLINLFFADTGPQRAQGLMYIRELDEMEGMLFRYIAIERITMWMKNTYVGLDMLFIKADGTLAKIAVRTTPLSTERISSDEPVAAVLELNAGFAERWLVEPGNRVLAVSEFGN